jgi:uncharacterized membrane protein YdjX (TVP38/TMEM64 family)
MGRTATVVLVLAVAGTVALGVGQWGWDISRLESWVERHRVAGAIVYVGALAASVVLLPLSSMPLLPVAARVYDVWLTTLLSVAGWWTGAIIAFQLARLGRRYVARIAALEALDRLERRIPPDIGFGGIVILRMIFPVDVVSFALGLLKELKFSTYATATLIGIVPFAAAWAYAGGELGRGQFLSFAVVVIAIALAVLGLRLLWKRSRS